MVLIADKKYACEACIKGHRASVCQHADRPLFEVKRKGRPVSQCQHCRDLRKTKQVHVRCNCALRSSEEGDDSGSACKCDQTGECHCCTIRTPYSGRKPKQPRGSTASVTPERNQSHTPPTIPVDFVGAALANGQRPLLPKPMHQHHIFVPATPEFPPSHASGSSLQLDHPPPPRSCCSGPPSPTLEGVGNAPPFMAPATPQEGHLSRVTSASSDPHAYTPDLSEWLTMFSPPTPIHDPGPPPPSSWTLDNLSLCECGVGCGCPGCPEHSNTAHHSSTSCSRPDGDTCSNCLECALVSVPPPRTNQHEVQESTHPPLGFAVDGQEASPFDSPSLNIPTQQDMFFPPSLIMPDNTT